MRGPEKFDASEYGRIPSRFPATTADRLNFISRKTSDQQMHLVIYLDGKVDPERLEEAFGLSMISEPILMSRFVYHGLNPYFKRSEQIEFSGAFRSTTVSDAESELERFIVQPADPTQDPLVQLILVRSKDDALCIKINHVVMDAIAAKDYGYLLSQIYSALEKDPGYHPAINLKGDRGTKPLTNQFSMAERLRLMRGFTKGGPLGLGSEHGWTFPYENRGTSKRRMIYRVIDPGVGSIREYAKKHQATVNDVVLAAFCRAMFKIIGPQKEVPLPFQVQFNLRNFLPDKRTSALTNLLAAVYPAIAFKESADFEGTLRSVKSEMDRMKATNEAMKVFYTYNILLKAFPFSITKKVYDRMTERGYREEVLSPLLSNIGIIQPERLLFGKVRPKRAMITTPIAYPGEVTLGFSSFADRMTFTIGFCEEGTDGGRVVELLESIDQDLLAVCGRP